MNASINWYGDMSREVGMAQRDWLPSVTQAIDPFFSEEDIEIGYSIAPVR